MHGKDLLVLFSLFHQILNWRIELFIDPVPDIVQIIHYPDIRLNPGETRARETRAVINPCQ